jgi:hypothetical protein
MGPLGLRYLVEDAFWEVWIYPTPVELVGGAVDGEVVVPGFTLELFAYVTVADQAHFARQTMPSLLLES